MVLYWLPWWVASGCLVLGGTAMEQSKGKFLSIIILVVGLALHCW
jgi:hypothetical protein